MTTLRIALAQINPTVGDLAGNREKIIDCTARARDQGADIVVFPELAIPGYPPEDLLLKPSFVAANIATLNRVAEATVGITSIVGFVDRDDDTYNAAAVLHGGKVAGVHHKTYLPNYSVFDEERYFRAGERALVFSIAKTKVGVNVCEDVWYPAGPTKTQALAGAHLVINISASPYPVLDGILHAYVEEDRGLEEIVALGFDRETASEVIRYDPYRSTVHPSPGTSRAMSHPSFNSKPGMVGSSTR